MLSILCCLIGWASQTEAQTVQDRSDAFRMNQKLGNGIVFGSIMWTFENTERYDIRDFELARDHDFNHVRICARMQNMQSSTGVLSEQSMDQLIAIIDDALANDLIAVICPFFWWKATLANEPPAFSKGDITALADMWEQIALRCKEEGYSLEDVVSELYEEPEFGIDVERLIEECVNKIKAVEHRYIIIPGRGFKTIVGMGRVFNDNDIPLDYDRLIGTFHFYEPKCEFCNLYRNACGVTVELSAYMSWPNETYDEAALRSWFVTLDQQNSNWASRNGTTKLPLYMGEYGTLNKPNSGNAGKMDLPREERKHWIWWTRMVAEEFGISTAYWNAYGNTSFGLGNYDANNPAARNMADPTDEELIRHSLLGRYEAEDLKSVASTSGFTIGSDTQTSHDYLSFLGAAPDLALKFDDIYVGIDGVYNVTIRFSNEHATALELDTQSYQSESTPLTTLTDVPFAVTGESSWYSKTIPMELEAGINTIELSGTTGDLRIDFIGVTQANKVFLDQGFDVAGQDDPNDYFSVDFDVSTENIQMQWNSVTGLEYTILRSYDLISWQTIETVNGDDLQKFFEESINPSDAVFYKIEVAHRSRIPIALKFCVFRVYQGKVGERILLINGFSESYWFGGRELKVFLKSCCISWIMFGLIPGSWVILESHRAASS